VIPPRILVLLECPHHLQVVPTEYYSRLGGVTETHQYSVTEYSTPIPKDGSRPPAIDLMYDLSPIVVTINERPPSILHYIVRISAVVGGVFAITSRCCQSRAPGCCHATAWALGCCL
jgi:hypothetical protein